MIGCAIFNTATLTILLANFGPYGNFINGIEHEPREEFRDYSYLRISSKVKNSKVFEQKVAYNRLWTPFKIQFEK